MSIQRVFAMIYQRVSSKKQMEGIEHVSCDVQTRECTHYALSKGFEVTDIYEDTGSGYKPENLKMMNKLTSDCKTYHEVYPNDKCVVLIYDVSRFCRNISKGSALLEKWANMGLEIHFVKERIIYSQNNSAGMLYTIQTLLVASEHERNKISERVKSSIQFRRSRGDFMGPRAPYGFEIYRDENKSRKLRENKDEQKNIKKILNMYSNDDQQVKILSYLNSKGTYRGKKWTKLMVQRIYKSHTSNLNSNSIPFHKVNMKVKKNIEKSTHRLTSRQKSLKNKVDKMEFELPELPKSVKNVPRPSNPPYKQVNDVIYNSQEDWEIMDFSKNSYDSDTDKEDEEDKEEENGKDEILEEKEKEKKVEKEKEKDPFDMSPLDKILRQMRDELGNEEFIRLVMKGKL